MNDTHAPKLTPKQWLICAIAALGFAFDIYELLMLPLIIGPMMADLAQIRPGTPEFNTWVGLLFYIPAVCGGIFGLIGGYLTDRFGRRTVLMWSILLYAFSAFAAGFSTSMEMFLVLRCFTFVGFCVEFVAGIAWLAELFPHPKQRESVLGYTQAFSSFGGLMVTGAYALCVKFAGSLPAIYDTHEAWRYTLMSGVIPAIPLILIRPWLPESPVWKEKKAAGTLRRPSFAELFSPALRKTTLITTLMVACSYGAALGALQQLPRIVPGLPEVAGQPRPQQQIAVSAVQSFQEIGGLIGRMLLAFLAVQIASRQRLIRMFLGPGLIVIPLVFLFPATSSLDLLKWGILLSGMLTVGQLSFWGNYLPRVYPTHLRGTGESFAANVGGRLIGTFAAVVTTQLATVMVGGTPFVKLAYSAALVAFTVYAVSLVASFWLPEPPKDKMVE
jgi:MFS family permease